MSSQKKKVARVARIPSPTAVKRREPTPEEVAILRLISEQSAVTVEQLGRFFGMYEADLGLFLEKMRCQRWVHIKPLVKGDSPWVWLRQSGATHAGLGFLPRAPTLSTIGHWYAITEVRLYLLEHAPGGDWVCERALRRGRGKRKLHIPDAVFKIEGEVHAIEAELSKKPPGRVEQVIAQHSERYDAVVYFCSPRVFTYLRRLELEECYPRLFTCELLHNLRQLPEEAFRVEADLRQGGRGAPREPEEWEVRILDLLAEQSGVPLDLLARFLKCDAKAADSVASHLLDGGFIKRAQPEEEGPDWIWLGSRGVKYATVKVGSSQPSLSALPNLRALSEVRLQILDRTEGQVEWTSGRALRREQGMKGSLPHAVVEMPVEGDEGRRERHAIDVRLTLTSDLEKLRARYCERAASYDWVVWYCAPHARRSALQLQKEFRCRKLIVRTIPGYQPPRGTRRRPKRAKAVAVFCKVPAAEVEAEVFEVVAMAAKREETIRIVSVERRQGIPMKEYRIGTNDGTWRVTVGQHGWKAVEILE